MSNTTPPPVAEAPESAPPFFDDIDEGADFGDKLAIAGLVCAVLAALLIGLALAGPLVGAGAALAVAAAGLLWTGSQVAKR